MSMSNWFTVSKEGLRKLIEHRGKVFIVYELVQNAWDEATHLVEIELMPHASGMYKLMVRDDNPDGFADITHAYTLYAESTKKGNAEKRGRFNLGEKLVLALCQSASIISKNNGVTFEADGTRKASRKRTESGTVFTAILKMTHKEYQEIEREVHRLIPPHGIVTKFNEVTVEAQTPLYSFDAKLQTVIADEEGSLRPTTRMTTVELYKVFEGEQPMLYEMGIPVVETGIAYNVNIMQKIPLNQDRDNVTPAYNRAISTAVLNNAFEGLTEEQATSTWVNVALGDRDVSVAAVADIITKRFGDKVVAYDPSDKEANARATMNGYHVLAGRSFNTEQWQNIRKSEAAPAAGRVFATAKPYSEDPNADPADVVDPASYTPGIRAVVAFAGELARAVLGVSISVTVVRTNNAFGACYGKSSGLDLNLKQLGHAWFNEILDGKYERIVALLAHEFAHHYEGDHLSENFYRSIQNLAGKICQLALTNPELFTVKEMCKS